jgi:hypothetical protein
MGREKEEERGWKRRAVQREVEERSAIEEMSQIGEE